MNTKGTFIPSYLLTKNVPFALLYPYITHIGIHQQILEVTQNNIFINILHGSYTPVQTRTRLNLPPQVKIAFEDAINSAIFVACLTAVLKPNYRRLIQHVDSKSDLRQLTFTKYNFDTLTSQDKGISSYVLYYNFDGQLTVAELFNECMNIMGTEQFTTEIHNKIVDHIRKRYVTSRNVVNNVIYLITGWLRNKNQHLIEIPVAKKGIPKRAKGVKEVEVEKEEIEKDKDAKKYIEPWITTYIEIARKIGIYGYTTEGMIKKIKVVMAEGGGSGWYTHKDKSITVNTIMYPPGNQARKKLFDVISTEKDPLVIRQKLKDNAMWEQFFDYRFPASTLPHELEHARRGSTHEGGNHDSIFVAMMPGDTPQERNFSEASNFVYQQVLAHDFYSVYLNKISKIKGKSPKSKSPKTKKSPKK